MSDEADFVITKTAELRAYHPDWDEAGLAYVVDRLRAEAFGQNGDEQSWFDEQPPFLEGVAIYDEWLLFP